MLDCERAYTCVRIFARVYARNECEGIVDFAPCFIPDAHRLLFSSTFVCRHRERERQRERRETQLVVGFDFPVASRYVGLASTSRGRINGKVLPELVRVSAT